MDPPRRGEGPSPQPPFPTTRAPTPCATSGLILTLTLTLTPTPAPPTPRATSGQVLDRDPLAKQALSASEMFVRGDFVLCGPMGDPFLVSTFPTDGAKAVSTEHADYGFFVVTVELADGSSSRVVVDSFVPTIDGSETFCHGGGLWSRIYMKASC